MKRRSKKNSTISLPSDSKFSVSEISLVVSIDRVTSTPPSDEKKLSFVVVTNFAQDSSSLFSPSSFPAATKRIFFFLSFFLLLARFFFSLARSLESEMRQSVFEILFFLSFFVCYMSIRPRKERAKNSLPLRLLMCHLSRETRSKRGANKKEVCNFLSFSLQRKKERKNETEAAAIRRSVGFYYLIFFFGFATVDS